VLHFSLIAFISYRNGKAVEYSGGRTADTIVAWVEKKTGPPAITLDSVDAAKKFVEDNKVAIVGLFKVTFGLIFAPSIKISW
jgi:hypothetical protein